MDFEVFGAEEPNEDAYDDYCHQCWRREGQGPGADAESCATTESSSTEAEVEEDAESVAPQGHGGTSQLGAVPAA